MNSLYEKIKRYYPRTNIYLLNRDHLNPVVKKTHPGAFTGKLGKETSVLFINGRLICDSDTPKKISINGSDEIFESNGTVVAARLSKSNLELVSNSLSAPFNKRTFEAVRSTARTTQVSARLIDHFFDLVSFNKEELKNDFSYHTRGGITRGRVHQTVAVYARGNIFIDDGSEVEAFCTLDARNGPIYISRGAKVQPYCRVEGPVFIGERSMITTGANIRMGTSIGADCKVGGEVEETIIHGRTNKHHYGFIGHSYIAEWVNMGAGTTNSDLKNNYGNIKIKYIDEETDSGKMFLGCAVADHTKTAIGTLINSGTVIGAASSVYGSSFEQKFIPSFSWGEIGKLKVYDPEKAIKTAKVVMSRRGVEMDDPDIDLFRKVFDLTESERNL